MHTVSFFNVVFSIHTFIQQQVCVTYHTYSQQPVHVLFSLVSGHECLIW